MTTKKICPYKKEYDKNSKNCMCTYSNMGERKNKNYIKCPAQGAKSCSHFKPNL